MVAKNQPATTYSSTVFSFYSNHYTLTREMCAEAELSRIDMGIAFVVMTLIFVVLAQFPSLPETIHEYFLSPSSSTILTFSGVTGIFVCSPLAAIYLLGKMFPRMVGEKRFKEQLALVPSECRQIDFYDSYVKVTGKFSRKLDYKNLKRTGETRHLYLLFFSGKQMLILPKSGFRKGTLPSLKAFLKKRQTWKTRIYGVIRFLPTIGYFLLYCYSLWTGW